MKELLKELQSKAEEIETELRSHTHNPACQNPRSCPTECSCGVVTDLHTSIAWEAADVVKDVDKALKFLEDRPGEVKEICTYLARHIHTLDSLRYIVGRHADRYRDLYFALTRAYFFVHDVQEELKLQKGGSAHVD